MGSPLSGILSDIFLNCYENEFLLSNKNRFQNQIIYYIKYVDDNFIICNGTTRQIEYLKNYMNSLNNKTQFTLEIKKDNSLCFLGITLIKQSEEFRFKIYRKPIATDVTIHSDSRYPYS